MPVWKERSNCSVALGEKRGGITEGALDVKVVWLVAATPAGPARVVGVGAVSGQVPFDVAL